MKTLSQRSKSSIGIALLAVTATTWLAAAPAEAQGIHRVSVSARALRCLSVDSKELDKRNELYGYLYVQIRGANGKVKATKTLWSAGKTKYVKLAKGQSRLLNGQLTVNLSAMDYKYGSMVLSGRLYERDFNKSPSLGFRSRTLRFRDIKPGVKTLAGFKHKGDRAQLSVRYAVKYIPPAIKYVLVPNVIGLSANQAAAKLLAAGLKPRRIYGASTIGPKVGKVYKTNPAAKKLVTSGMTVNYYVYTGKLAPPPPNPFAKLAGTWVQRTGHADDHQNRQVVLDEFEACRTQLPGADAIPRQARCFAEDRHESHLGNDRRADRAGDLPAHRHSLVLLRHLRPDPAHEVRTRKRQRVHDLDPKVTPLSLRS